MRERAFYRQIRETLDAFVAEQDRRCAAADYLTIDLHCHDHNSDVPDEILGRILGVPETWLPTDDLMGALAAHGCDAFTITNHNNARSCYELQDRGIDVLTGAEFSCMVPDFKVGIHVLAYGFTPEQEKKLDKRRGDVYRLLKYAREHDIPTVWAHPLYHYRVQNGPPMEFFDKMALVFERFEAMNGQRDTWQNMLVKTWIERLTPESIEGYAKQFGIPADRYCRDPYRKAMAGGSDSHMGIFAGLTGTRLIVPNLAERLKTQSRSSIALDAIRMGAMAPFGSHNDGEKMTVSFLDYFCQIAMNMKDPGLVRMMLHKGEPRDKMLAMLIANAFQELRLHRVTMKFLDLFHQCLSGTVPRAARRFLVPRAYRAIFQEASSMAVVRRDRPEEIVARSRDTVRFIFEELSRLLFDRLRDKLGRMEIDRDLRGMDLGALVESMELPSGVRSYLTGERRRPRGRRSVRIADFLDGLSFPFLGSAVILSAWFVSASVLYKSRDLLGAFAERLNAFRHPKRALWLTDTFEDNNGVAMVLQSLLTEIRRRDLPIDILACSNRLKSGDHLIVLKPQAEYTMPFYEQQPVRIPPVLEIHRIFQEGEYDRIVCSTEGPMGCIGLYLKAAYSVPAHFFVHTDWMMFARQVLNFDQRNRDRLRRMIRAFYRGFDGLFVLNADQRKWLTGRDMGFAPERVFATAHWADEGFSPRAIDRMSVIGVNGKTPVLLFAGRVSEEKGVRELPAIYKRVRASVPDAVMVIAGTGPAEAALRDELPEARFLGWVDHARLAEVYSAADVLLLPSKFDTFGCVVLEALSCGLPVIAYNTKGPKDIIRDGECGYLCASRADMADAAVRLIGDRERLDAFRDAALARAREYDADVINGRLKADLGLPIAD